MKAQMIEENGFPKPQGLLIMLLVIGLLCFLQCVFSQAYDNTILADNSNFPINEGETNSGLIADIEQNTADIDPEPEIEEWMIDESYWLKNYRSGLEAEESKPEVSIKQLKLILADLEQNQAYINSEPEIEEWMTDGSYWLISTKNCDKQNEVKEDK